MNKWTRLTIAAGFSVAAITVGLTSATASGVRPGGPSVPAANLDASANMTPNAISSHPVAKPEAVYVPIAPCRIVDTRNAVGFLGNGVTRTYYVGGTTGFAPQGGKSGGCGIPVGATAVAATVTAVSPTIGGYLRAYPNGQSEPTATTLNYAAHVSNGTGATLSINNSSAYALKVTNHSGRTDLVIDVTGYYNQQIEGMINGNTGALYSGSDRFVSATRNSTGSFTVTVDTDVSYCTPTVTPYSGYVYASAYAFNSNKIQVYMWYLNSSTHVETAVDGYFYLKVAC